MVSMSTLTWLGVPGDERAWAALGFVVDEGGFTVGRVRCSIGGSGWGFDEIHSDPSVLGVPTVTSPAADPTAHPCGVTAADHSDPKPAVQGGRIASVWSEHLKWGLAVMGV
jgi:hypothetical protein